MTKAAFAGKIEFTVSIRAFDESVMRTAKIDYDYTPTWPYCDVGSKTERVGEPQLDLRLSMLVPRLVGRRSTLNHKAPHWAPLDQLLEPGLLRKKLYDRLHASIDYDALHTDRMNRKRAGLPVPRTPENL